MQPMKRKRTSKSPRTAVLLGILSALLAFKYSSPEPDTVKLPPKQPPHVVYVLMCGILEGIIITTDPIQYADFKKRMTPEMRKLEAEAIEAGRTFNFSAGLWVMCGEPFPEDFDTVIPDEDEETT